jgi:hypothetical protein
VSEEAGATSPEDSNCSVNQKASQLRERQREAYCALDHESGSTLKIDRFLNYLPYHLCELN